MAARMCDLQSKQGIFGSEWMHMRLGTTVQRSLRGEQALLGRLSGIKIFQHRLATTFNDTFHTTLNLHL